MEISLLSSKKKTINNLLKKAKLKQIEQGSKILEKNVEQNKETE